MSRFCGECGAPAGETRFCPSCGTALETAQAEAATPAPTPAAERRSVARRTKILLASGGALLVIAAAAGVTVLATGDSEPTPAATANVSCKAFATKTVAARRAALSRTSRTAASDTTLVLVDSFCETSPSATVRQGLAAARETPVASDGPVPTVAAGVRRGVPADAVAIVGGAPLSRGDFDRWLDIARKTSGGSTSAADTAALNDQVMQFLLLERWVAGESAATGIRPPASLVKREFAKAKQDSFPDPGAYDAFLAKSGMTDVDARFQTGFNTHYTLLRERAVLGARPAADAEVAAFYRSNRAKWESTETRDVQVVLTKSAAAAREAGTALTRGQSWDAVAREFSIDEGSKDKGGLLKAIAKGTQEASFDRAIFSAPPDELRGPIKTQFGYYLIKVQSVTPGRKQTLAQARPAVRILLENQRKQQADGAFNTSLRKRWRAVTLCAPEFVMKQCSNDA